MSSFGGYMANRWLEWLITVGLFVVLLPLYWLWTRRGER